MNTTTKSGVLMHPRVMAVFIALSVVATAGLRAQQRFTLFASFIDVATGEPVTAVTQDQLEMRENDVAGKILLMEPINWPVKVELLLDNGVGVGDSLIHLRNGVRAFMEAVPSGVEVSLITTSPQPRNVVRPTTDRLAQQKGFGLLTLESAAGRFIESLSEAAARIDKARDGKERDNFFPVIVSLGSTAAEGSRVIERDVERLLQRFQRSAATVHVIMLSSAGFSPGGGADQVQVGLLVTKLTGGRYENIAAPSRISTLLPEIAQQIAKSHRKQSNQFRLTVERPSGASGPVGRLTLAGPSGMQVQLSLDGHLP